VPDIRDAIPSIMAGSRAGRCAVCLNLALPGVVTMISTILQPKYEKQLAVLCIKNEKDCITVTEENILTNITS